MEPIALVNCCLPSQPHRLIGPPQGSLYLATSLIDNGIAVKIYDTSVDMNPYDFTADSLYQYLKSIPNKIIGISIWDSVMPKVVLSIQKLKNEHPEKIIIIGGPSASALGDRLMHNFQWIDYAVIGEGEVVINNLLSWIASAQHDLTKLADKIIGRSNGKIFRGKKITPSLEIGKIPVPDYSLIDRGKYNRAEIVTTRGCSHNCIFCSVNSAWGDGIRFRHIEQISKELEILFSQQGIEHVHILDDNFGSDDFRFNNFINSFTNNYSSKQWSCCFRMDGLDKRTVDLMTKSGCCGVYVGIGLGSSHKYHHKRESIDKDGIVNRIKYAAARMNIIVSFIWGLPDETYDQFRQTLDLIDTILDFNNIFVNLYQLSPLSGTRILKELKDRLIFEDNRVSGFTYPPYLSPLSEDEKSIIRQFPEIFSAFYHEDSHDFENKFVVVNKFLGQNIL